MNNSWKSTSQSSPGFVYFTNTSTTPQKSDTADFLSFSDKEQTPTKHRFSPRNFSSPHQKQQWGSPRNNYQGRHKGRFQNNQSFSPNKTYNSSFNHSNSSFGKQHNISKGDKSFNKNAYLHPSFTENPWAELEAKLKQLKEETKSKSDDDSSGSEVSDDDGSSDSNT